MTLIWFLKSSISPSALFNHSSSFSLCSMLVLAVSSASPTSMVCFSSTSLWWLNAVDSVASSCWAFARLACVVDREDFSERFSCSSSLILLLIMSLFNVSIVSLLFCGGVDGRKFRGCSATGVTSMCVYPCVSCVSSLISSLVDCSPCLCGSGVSPLFSSF